MPSRIGFTPQQLNDLTKGGIQKHIGLYLGPVVLGFAFDSMLLGCIIQQLIWNIIWCPSDRLFNKIILFSAVLLSVITTIFNDCFLFHAFASGFGNWYRLIQLDYIRWFPILDCATVTLVHIFYLERAYQLHNRSKWVPIAVLPFLLASTGGAIGSTVMLYTQPDAYDLSSTKPVFYTWIGGTLIVDLLITSIIFHKLIRSRTGWSDTDLMINKLITISVETQLPSLIVAIAFMVSYGVKPGAGLNVFFELFHPKVHVVGLLTVLNSRNKLRNELNGPSKVKENTFHAKKPKASKSKPKSKSGNKDKDIENDIDDNPTQPTVILEDGLIVPHLGTRVESPIDDEESGLASGSGSGSMIFLHEQDSPSIKDGLAAGGGSTIGVEEGFNNNVKQG
ncbi:hypothetical protein I302_106213 [Kwoniella bestiolae CBS 10118]|uniref:DUF6534 domain-containing protein n=1 Tax=Kwoniella bestiolae CBS 10118 TaxID=1296100 RepID=A0A1B9G3F5_9TREE|nr:hypothetical protein I302_05338 [Kwoniella bestiolae CBS 10118]OCF25518.1 hypothetical protein I302_05338 [Kwoniella bestiolae CBS 10118]